MKACAPEKKAYNSWPKRHVDPMHLCALGHSWTEPVAHGVVSDPVSNIDSSALNSRQISIRGGPYFGASLELLNIHYKTHAFTYEEESDPHWSSMVQYSKHQLWWGSSHNVASRSKSLLDSPIQRSSYMISDFSSCRGD